MYVFFCLDLSNDSENFNINNNAFKYAHNTQTRDMQSKKQLKKKLVLEIVKILHES